MELIEDRRVSRTKELIRQSLISLIAERGFDVISVKDITTRANINRGTFYLHYKDKFDLLNQTLQEVIRGLENITLETAAFSDDEIVNTTILSNITVRLFKFLDAKAPLIQALFTIKGTNSLENAIKELARQNIFKENTAAQIKNENLLAPKEYLISYISSAHIGVIQEWLAKKVRETPEEMAEILINLSLRGPLISGQGVWRKLGQ